MTAARDTPPGTPDEEAVATDFTMPEDADFSPGDDDESAPE